MIPSGPGSARRPHPDSPAEADPNEESRRVRPRTQQPGAGDALPGLSPRGAPPGGSLPESPRRPSVSVEQLQQWHGSTGPGSPGQAAPGALASLIAVAHAGTSSSRPPGAVQPAAFDPMQAIPPEGRNTLVAYAVAQHLGETGTPASALPKARSALIHFGSALLQEQPPVPLNEFLDRLHSPEPAERDAAAALKDRVMSGPGFDRMQRYGLRAALRALPNIPPERRMLTLQQALHTKMQAPALKTLLPTADLDLLQQVQDFDRDLSPVAAGQNQVLLIRLGIALMAEGHRGLAGWLEMHDQPEGSRLANELLERFKNGPELALSDVNKTKLGQAAVRLRACALGEGGGSSNAALAPRFPADFPPAEASLTEACLQAGLDKGLSRATLYRYGRELIGLSEWLRQPADADRPAQPTGLHALRDLSEAGQRDLVAAFVASRPISSVTTNAAVGLLLTLPAPVPGPAGTPASTPQPAPASPSVPFAAGAGEAAAGPSAAAASPSTSAWSLESAYERVGGAEGIQAWIREMDEVMSGYRPDVSAPAGPSRAIDLASQYRQLTADDSTAALLQSLGGAMARAHPQAEAATDASAAGESAPVAGPPNAAAPDAAPAVVHAMPAEAAVQWFNSRLQDIQMASSVHGQIVRAELLLFADHLAEGPGEGALHGLNGFLQRYESSDPSLRRAARAELQQYLGPQGRSARMAGRRDSVVRGLDLLSSISAAQRLWTDPATRISQDRVGNMNKRRLLPPQDRALLERVHPAQRSPLARFARAMLSEGRGGLAHWLLMFREGRGPQARQLMLDFNAANRGRLSQPGNQLLAASGVRAVAPDLPGPSARVPSPGLPRRPSQAAPGAPASPIAPAQASTSSSRPPGAEPVPAAADPGPVGMQAWMQEMDRMFSHRARTSAPAGPSQAFDATRSGLSRAGERRPAIPVGLGSARRPHPDSAADPNEESRRVRPRTQVPGAGDALSRPSPQGAPPGGSLPGSPPRSLVSAEQLQQWRSHTGPRSARQATPGTWASPIASAQASTSSPRPSESDAVAARPDAFDAMHGVPPKGRNTLVVYAAQQVLREDGVPNGRLADIRSALNRFGDALLQRQPAVTLAQLLDRLSSLDLAERDAAIELTDALVNEHGFPTGMRYHLDVAFKALSETPSERRMLTLQQALHSTMKAPALKTLLPEADATLLRQVQDFDKGLHPTPAGQNQVLLIRLGIALMAEGHGGLAGWLEMHGQPEGSRLANELLERFKNGPELALSDVNKRRFDLAVARLQASALGEGGGASGAALAPRFPADFPPAEASLTDACLQAGLDKGLSRATLYKYGRELIGLSEWLRKPAEADRPPQPTGLRALLDLSRADQRDLVASFVATRPAAADTISAAVSLLLSLPAPVPVPAGRTASPQGDPLQRFAESLERSLLSPGPETDIRTAQPSSSTAPPQDDPLQGFAESLERSLASSSPEPDTRQRDAVPAAPASPRPDAMGDDVLVDPGTPTAGDFAFLTDPFGPGHGGGSIQDPWSDLALTDDEPDRPATPPDSGR